MLRSTALKPTISSPSSAAQDPKRAYGAAAAALLAAIAVYKLLISPLFTGACRFNPSCADYMAEAVRQHGAMRGAWLGLRRLWRCRPFGGYGVDPVPRL